jgi:signal peptidase I
MVNSLLLGILLCFVLLMIVRCLFFVAVIEGQSMLPNFEGGEKVLVFRYWPLKWLPHNAVIVTHLTSELTVPQPTLAVERGSKPHLRPIPGRIVIKRVVGFPGETIKSSFPSQRKWQIPPEHYFVRSDGVGVDSDTLGPVSFDCFQGLVVAKLSARKVNNVG